MCYVVLGLSTGFFLPVDRHSWKMVLKVRICSVVFDDILCYWFSSSALDMYLQTVL